MNPVVTLTELQTSPGEMREGQPSQKYYTMLAFVLEWLEDMSGENQLVLINRLILFLG